MKVIIYIFFFFSSLFSYDFILLNSTEIDDSTIVESIQEQFDNYYSDENNSIDFYELESKEEILQLMGEYDYSGDKDEQKALIRKNQDISEDLEKIFKTKYFLIVSERKDREGRDELNIILKVDNINYFDSTFLMPRLDDKESHYIDTIVNIVLTYITYKDKNFIRIHQL
jgi:hypothetical protein